MTRRTGASQRSTFILAAAALLLVAVVAVAAYLAFGGGSDSYARAKQTPVVTDAEQVSVGVIEYDYTPRTLTVRKGATITWDFTGEIPHTVTNDTGKFDSKVKQTGSSFSFTFDTPGEYYYFCTLHHVMEGMVTVTE
jgi:plastocyanin